MKLHPRLVIGLCWFNGLSGIYGGGYLIGGAKGMNVSYLHDTPFSSFTIPGFILLLVVGGSSTLAAAARLGRHPLSTIITIGAAAILLGWLTVEFVMLPEWWPAQAFYGIVGVAMLAGGVGEWRAGHSETGNHRLDNGEDHLQHQRQ